MILENNSASITIYFAIGATYLFVNAMYLLSLGIYKPEAFEEKFGKLKAMRFSSQELFISVSVFALLIWPLGILARVHREVKRLAGQKEA